MRDAIENTDPSEIEHLSTVECWTKLEATARGRLAVIAVDGMPDVFPVNYAVHEGSVYIRSAPGSKLLALLVHPFAAFEIDGDDEGTLWSVVLRGSARRLAVDKEIRESGVRALVSDNPTPKHDFICVTPTSVSGRRFTVHPQMPNHAATRRSPMSGQEPSRDYEETTEWPHTDVSDAKRPTPIPHFPPR